ncbi:hypothetical protein PMIT1323_00141 [Prochlorococcus marinus str. MIT 1323]|nr:hypothetical protein PMIT1323_00141 [Prochlorococcus marinus str. MIT 1323]
MLCDEQFCLRVLSELDQLEEYWLEFMYSQGPEAVATSYQMLGASLGADYGATRSRHDDHRG